MKVVILAFSICTVLVSCSKEINSPSRAESTATVSNSAEGVQPKVIFNISSTHTIYLSQVRNTIQSDSFSVTGKTAYISSFAFKVTGSADLINPGFYINGGQVKTMISYSNDSIFVVMKSPIALMPGNYSYILQAKTVGISGSSFSISLTSAVIVDAKKHNVDINNLPQVGNNFILN
jgi:hypothetical protein